MSSVITNHPGGYELINSVRGREVDRFIYGSEAVESVEKMRVHSHSAASIAMAGPPIGFLASTCPFNNMDEINDVTLERCVLPCKSQQIYAPYLVSKSESFVYKGYEEVRQIGKYYAVTIIGKKTRLYTLVNFLHTSNLKLMSRIIGKNFSHKNEA